MTASIMRKIASPQELSAELRRLLAYCSGPEKPSRDRLATELRELADRVAAKGLRPQDLKRGLNIVETAHPEYGVWFVVRESPPGTWEVARSGRPSDMKAVDEAELMKFWQKAKS